MPPSQVTQNSGNPVSIPALEWNRVCGKVWSGLACDRMRHRSLLRVQKTQEKRNFAYV